MAAAVEFDPSRPGKYKVVVGDSLRSEDGQIDAAAKGASNYASFRYNTKPPGNGSKLKRQADGQFGLFYEDEDEEVEYTGSQRSGRKLECLLVYNPKDNSFSLERMSSILTFNQALPVSNAPPLPTSIAQDLQDETSSNEDEEEQLADVENPFDIRHFLGKAQASDDDDSDRKDEDEDTDMDMETEQPFTSTPVVEQEIALTPGLISVATPIPAISTPIPVSTPSLPLKRKAAPKKPVDPFMKLARKPRAAPAKAVVSKADENSTTGTRVFGNGTPKDASMSPQSALPSPMHIDSKPASYSMPTHHSSSESDEDAFDEESSDEDQDARPAVRTPAARNLRPEVMSREPSHTGSILSSREPDVLEFPNPQKSAKDYKANDSDDELDLMRALEQEFDDVSDADDVLVVEGDTGSSGIGLGIGGVSTAVPMSLSRMAGGGRRDSSEEESSEEE